MPTMQELRERLTAEQRQQIEDAHAEYLASLPENVRNYLEERRREALRIDPGTAQTTWWYVGISDPYGVDPLKDDSVGRGYFARNPGSDIWVCFDDLPEKVRDRLWKLHRHTLAFPVGLGLSHKGTEST